MFRKPGEKRVGVKVLSYGKKGTGKSVFALSFPNIAMIDAENGVSFYEGGEYGKNLKIIANTQSFKELDEAIDYVQENYEDDKIETFAIDSLTKVRQNIEETIMTFDERRAREKGRSADEASLSVRSWGRIGYLSRKIQNAKIDLSSNGVNVVDIAQEKDVKEKKGDEFVVVGVTPDLQKNADYDYDIVLRHFVEEVDGEYVFKAFVEKDRTEVLQVGSVIENPSYEIWKDYLKKRKKNDTLSTNFSKSKEIDTEKLEEESESEEKTIEQQVMELVSKLDEEKKNELKQEIKDKKIKKLNSLTSLQKETLQLIIEKYKKFV